MRHKWRQMYGQINVVNTISNTNRRQVDPKTSQLGCKLPRRGVQSRCFHFSFNIFLSKRLSAPASGCSIAQYVQPTQCLIHTQGTQFVHVVIENKYVVSQIYFSSAIFFWGGVVLGIWKILAMALVWPERSAVAVHHTSARLVPTAFSATNGFPANLSSLGWCLTIMRLDVLAN